MPTITTVDATWETTSTLDAAELRRIDTAMFLGDGSNNGVRGGIVRHGDNSLAVTVNGSDQVTVQAGAAVIPGATGLGVYRAALSAATAATGLASRNATNPRIDLVVFQIVSGRAEVKTVDGTPGSSPSAPALPANAIELARLTVPALGGGAVTVDSTWRAYAAGLGGTLQVEQANRLPGSGNQKGQRAVALDTGRDHRWNGTAWVDMTAPISAASSVFMGSPVASVPITFPVGRFAAPPMVTASCTSGGNVAVIPNIGPVSTTGFTAFLYGVGGTWSTGSVSLFWHAIESH